MGESSEEYTIIEDEREPIRVSPRCSVVKISCGFIPSSNREDTPSADEEPTVRGDPYTSGRLDATYAAAMSILDTLFDIDLDDPEQREVSMRIRADMAHYRILIDRFSDTGGDSDRTDLS